MIKICINSLFILSIVSLCACKQAQTHQEGNALSTEYYNDTAKVKNGGVQIIPITTKNRKFNIWTKKIGNNPKIKLLLLTADRDCLTNTWSVWKAFYLLRALSLSIMINWAPDIRTIRRIQQCGTWHVM
jgi:hypothetical protein